MYKVEIGRSVLKQFVKLDKQTQKIIIHLITKNLVDLIYPRIHGKELKGNSKGI